MSFNLGAIRQAHARFMRANHDMVMDELRRAEDTAKVHVREHAVFRHRTNAIRRGVQATIIRTSSGGIIRLTNTAPHAKFLEFGTKPHIIRARRGKALSFFWLRLGRKFVGPVVHHPGTKPYFFMRAARDAAAIDTRVRLIARMQEIAARF